CRRASRLCSRPRSISCARCSAWERSVAEYEAQDRTEQATPKRLEEARRQGDIPRSRDLATAAGAMAGALSILLVGSTTTGRIYDMMRGGIALDPNQALDESYMLVALKQQSLQALLACAPIFGAIVLAAILAPLLLGGWSFSANALLPNPSRLSPEVG